MSTSVGGPPVNHGLNDSVNGGRNQTIPAVPSSVVNGNNNFSGDQNRKPSMMVTAAGATSYNTNGGAQGKPSNIQFGSMNAAGSPAMGTPTLAHQSSASLGVNSLNPRGSSPQGSPSPIPQPASVSGGRPPSSFQGQGNGLSFGQIPAEGGDNANMRTGLAPQFTPQNLQEHMRRGSSQSIHSDLGTPSLPTGPGRGGYGPGRGRGSYTGGYQGGQVGFSPNYRQGGQNGRGMATGYQGQGRHQMPYQGSPNLGTRSPMMHNATPGTPQMGQMQMMPTMQGQPGGYPMGPYQGYGVPAAADPSIQYNYNLNFYPQAQMQGQYGQYPPPQSPRPPYQQPGYGTHMQQTYSNQGQVPTSMSRQSSQISTTATDRPSSSIGQTPHSASITAPSLGARTPSMSAQKPDFTLPVKKSSAIQIKNAAGEIVTFGKGNPSANTTPSAATPIVPTPPSRTPSAADHTRSESTVKSDEEKKKAMQEAVAKKVAEEQAKLKQERDAADQKAQMDKEAAELAEREAAKAKEEAERLEKEAKEAAEAKAAKEAKEAQEAKEAADAKAAKEAQDAKDAEAAKAAKEAQDAKDAEEKAKADAAAAAKPADDDEPDYDAIEAEMAAIEAEEARREQEYQQKKAAAREAQRKKEQEEAAAYEANMKEAERKAEEEELAREKKAKEGGTDDEVARKMFAALKSGDADTPISTDDSPAQTPAESGAVTPVSDGSMPPPKGLGPSKRPKIADLTLDTKKSIEPPEPSATLKSLTAARRLEDPTKVDYPAGIVSPNPALNANAPADRKFKYNKEFLLQFQSVFKEKPSLDWDTKIREALGDGDASSARPGTARTPSTNMGGRSASRTAAGGTFPAMGMGTFGGGRPLPPNSTSEQRFAASNAALRGAPMANPFATFGRGSMGAPMGRTPSNNPLGPIPGSPRMGGGPSRGGSRAESKRKNNNKHDAQDNKSMPLTAGLQITALETSTTGWKPRSIGQPQTGPVPGGEGHLEPDVVQRKVKAALNKMTPEKFDKIADQILEIAAQSRNETDGRTLRQVIQLTFEKATDEAHWAPMYASFCRKMLQNMTPEVKDENIKDKNGDVVTGGNLFRKYLLNRCQEEFERGWKVNLPARKEGETEEMQMLSEEYYIAAAAKRRGLGLVKFIGELFKLGMLTERIMHECVKKLVDYEGMPDESEVESLTGLLRTIGKQLDSPESRAQGRMDVYFERINQIIVQPDLPSRLRFMLMDIVDLRKNGWSSAADDKGPKTIAEIHEEAERAAQKAEMQRLASHTGGRGGGRMPMGRGDARSFSYGQAPPPDNSNRVGADDLRRLGGARTSRNPSNPAGPSLGPPSMLGGRTNSGRRGLGPGGLLSRGNEDSAASSRNGSSSAKDKEKKDEASTNAFSALAGLDSHEGPSSNPSSPPTQKSQPNIERQRSRSPEKTTE